MLKFALTMPIASLVPGKRRLQHRCQHRRRRVITAAGPVTTAKSALVAVDFEV
jgi:hypothetical protein